MKQMLFIICLIIPFLSGAQSEGIQNKRSLIIGAWHSETDEKWKLVFSVDGTCIQYYEDRILETNKYAISNTTPQCGENVLVNDKTSYLSLINQETEEEWCYEIYGVTEKYLNIRPIDRGGFMIFVRQNVH